MQLKTLTAEAVIIELVTTWIWAPLARAFRVLPKTGDLASGKDYSGSPTCASARHWKQRLKPSGSCT